MEDMMLRLNPISIGKGGMMAQAARDPIYLAALTIANQDVPHAGDFCIRCHAPEGWLGGRSEPADGSALTDADREGSNLRFLPSDDYADRDRDKFFSSR